MKRTCFLGGFLLLAMIPFACGPNGSGGYGGMSTTSPGGNTIGAVLTGGYTYAYSPSSLTIMHGQSVTWNSTNAGHDLNIDSGSGTCLVSGQTSYPYSYTFATAGTYHFHCGIHSSCGNGTCPSPSTCTGMIGTITVN